MCYDILSTDGVLYSMLHHRFKRRHRWRTFASIHGTQVDRSLLFSIGWPIVRMPFCFCCFMLFGRKSYTLPCQAEAPLPPLPPLPASRCLLILSSAALAIASLLFSICDGASCFPPLPPSTNSPPDQPPPST